MPEQDFQAAELLGPSSQNISNLILGHLLAPSLQSPEGNLPARISQILKGQLIYVPNLADGPKKSLITLALIFCLLSFAIQLTWFTVGLTYCRLSISHWVVRKNELGLFVPNTRYLLGILNVSLTILLVSESALLILNLKDTSSLKYRAMIAGSMWLPLWFTSWVYAWGVGTGIYISISKMPKGILGKLIDWKYSAQAFNTLAFGSLVIGAAYEVSTLAFVGYSLMTLMDTHDRTVARFQMMASFYDPQTFSLENTILQEVSGLIDMARSYENWLDKFQFLLFSRSVSFLAFIWLSIPLYNLFFTITRGMKDYYCDVVTFNTTYLGHMGIREENVPPYEDNPPASQASKPSPISAVWEFLFSSNNHVASAVILSIGHTLVEVTVMIRFIYLWQQTDDVNELVKSLASTAFLSNLVLAFTGLLPSWLFYKRSQSSRLEMIINSSSLNTIQGLTVPDVYDPWTLTSPIISDIEILPGSNKLAIYSTRPRPQLRNFPDIRYVKEYLLTEDTGHCEVTIHGFPSDQKKSPSD